MNALPRLLLVFALAVRRVLHKPGGRGQSRRSLWAGTTVIVALLLVAMAMQITIAKTADGLGAETVRALGADFGLVLIAMWGFVMAFTGLAYAVSVMAQGVLPRWTAWLAIVALVVNVVGTAGVFFDSGPFSMESGFTAWAPALSVTLWYLGTSIALLRTRDRARGS
jgi:hypothetical protein